jgi:hypothetical protein
LTEQSVPYGKMLRIAQTAACQSKPPNGVLAKRTGVELLARWLSQR